MCQDYNLGNKSDWFGSFRGGLYGFYTRLYGVAVHHEIVHAWLPTLRTPIVTEYHFASILFSLDSTIECLTFALNALGYAALPSAFRDISNEREFKRISPKDLQKIFVGGRARSDPPSGFYHSLGIADDIHIPALYWPMAEIILQNDPKLPRTTRTLAPTGSRVLLETVAVEFAAFIQQTGIVALTDAQRTITIPEPSFRAPESA